MTKIARTLLSTLHFSGADAILAPYTRGLGAILKLHHVRPEQPCSFEPNRKLKVTPDFLERAIAQVRQQGFDIISLDEAQFRLLEGETSHMPFVCFTFDDGYRDNLEHAYPIFRRHRLPFTIYVATDYPDGHGDLWWVALEHVVACAPVLDLKIDGLAQRLSCGTVQAKEAAFRTIYRWLRTIREMDARAIVRELCQMFGVDVAALCRDQIMTWDEIRGLAADPLVTIGAHSRRHYALSQLTLAEARGEMEASVGRVAQETGQTCRHFSYPYGDAASAGPREFDLARELGMKTAVTARPGPVHLGDAHALTCLPRVALDGAYQKSRYVKVLLSGAPFAMGNALLGAEPSAS